MLDAYFERIGFDGPVQRDFRTLVGIHRAHITSVPWDNLDVQLGRENVLAEEAFFEKIVRRRRGGWCYETNGLLTHALREIGFPVTRLAGAAWRDTLGILANHLFGVVALDRRYVVDVGFADGPLDPYPLEERRWSEGRLDFRLERLPDGWWRFHNHAHGLAPYFDFTEEPCDLPSYQGTCTRLQTEESSPFVQYAFASRRSPDGCQALRDTTHFQLRDGAMTQCEVADGADYCATLASVLGNDLGADAMRLWERVEARATARAQASGA